MRTTISPDALEQNWKKRFPGLAPDHLSIAHALEEKCFELEGHEFRVIDLGHTDTDDTTGLYVPSLDLMIAGDAVYNETHPFLVETDKMGRQRWLAALDRIAVLAPKDVIVGHGPLEPDNRSDHIEATRKYILDFDRIDSQTCSAREMYDQMLELYPRRINPGSLWGSAVNAKGGG